MKKIINGREYDITRGANLREANLWRANLREANLWRANLWRANLWGADLRRANLQEANLQGANLQGANLQGADLQGANLPSPTMILLANWTYVKLSVDLTIDLMEYDASCHPCPSAFALWAGQGPCPYQNVRVERACLFTQDRKLAQLCDWNRIHRPYDLMMRLFKAAKIKR